jgi:hypothetical protein
MDNDNENIIYEYPMPDRLVIIGDIHGDIKRFKNILLDAKIINNNIEWIAEPQNTIVIQMGDQIDSLNRVENNDWEVIEDLEMIKFTDLLDKIANAKGGKVISIIGNHEFMNILGNYTYVSAKSIANNVKRRIELFKPGGQLSKILSDRPIIIKIGSLLFCHAGLTVSHLFVLQKYNKDIFYLNKLWKLFVNTNNINNSEDSEIFSKIILDDDGILWTRNLTIGEELNIVLKSINCNHMFVGHTVVDNIKLINNNLWYTDTGISRAFGNKSYQYIDIVDNNVNIKTLNN